jgi:LysM repeat protein
MRKTSLDVTCLWCLISVFRSFVYIRAMDNLSSSDLDTSSKTPLFIGIAAVILALTGVILGWYGFSKASDLEAQLAEVSSAAISISDLKSTVEGNSGMIRRMAGKLGSIETSLAGVTGGVQKDIASIKKSMRTVAIEAGTALKKIEALEKNGVKAAAPKTTGKPSTSSGVNKSVGSKTTTISGDAKTHTIKSGDTYQKIGTLYKVSVNDLIDANPGVDPRRLKIGQSIVVPSSGN